MDTQAKPGKFILMYGGLLGLIGVAFQVMLFLQDAHITSSQNVAVTVISILIGLGMTAVGIFAFRKANGGYLKMGQSIWIGVGMALVSGLITILYTLLLTNVLDPDYISEATNFRLQEAIDKGQITPEIADQQRQMSNDWFYAFLIGGVAVVGSFFGLLYGLIIGLFAKKAQPTY